MGLYYGRIITGSKKNGSKDVESKEEPIPPPPEQFHDDEDPCAGIPQGRGRRLMSEDQMKIACKLPTKVKPEEHILGDAGRTNLPMNIETGQDVLNRSTIESLIRKTRISFDLWGAIAFAVQEAYKPERSRRFLYRSGNNLYSYVTGFSHPYLAVYQDTNNRNLIIAIPGTNLFGDSLHKNIFADLYSDLNIALGGSPYEEANKIKIDITNFLSNYKNFNIYIAGHSLGGSIVQSLSKSDLSLNSNIQFIGFNSGSSPLQFFNSAVSPGKFISLRMQGDAISASLRDVDFEFIPEINTNAHSMSQFTHLFSP